MMMILASRSMFFRSRNPIVPFVFTSHPFLKEVLFWGPLLYPPSPRMFCFISRLLLKLAF